MGTMVLKPCQFGSISEWYPDDNLRRRDAGALYISRFQNPGDAFRSLVQFDLSKLPADKEIKTACLQLYIYRNEIPGGSIKARLFPLIQAWNENHLSWNNQAARSDAPAASFIIPSGWRGFILFEIGFLVRGWLDGSIPNYGCMISGDEGQDRLVAFASSEYPEKDKYPQLIVSLEDQ